MKRTHTIFPLCVGLLLSLCLSVAAQTTSSFTYQGRLNDTGTPATGSYDFQFKLFDALAGGNQVGSTNSQTSVPVTNGVFNVSLDFGAAAFPGAARFLDISVRLAGSGAFTTLTPRRTLNPVPYAVKSLSAAIADSLSAACTGCVADAQIGAIAGSKVTGTIPVAGIPAGSGNYIQNSNALQAGGNFNIGGNGFIGGKLGIGMTINNPSNRLDITNASASFFRVHEFESFAGTRLMASFDGSNSGPQLRFSGGGASFMDIGQNGAGDFVVEGADIPRLVVQNSGNIGIGNTAPAAKLDVTGTINTSTQYNLGGNRILTVQNTGVGSISTFAGVNAGTANSTGFSNSFFGSGAGAANTSGIENAFFGSLAGNANTTGIRNTFFGHAAGSSNTTGGQNTSFGNNAGASNAAGDGNAFFGWFAGRFATTGGNSFFGAQAGQTTSTGALNTFMGRSVGSNNSTGSDNSFFGALSGELNTTGQLNSFFGKEAGRFVSTGTGNTLVGALTHIASSNLTNATAIGFRAAVNCSNCVVIGSVLGVNDSANDVAVGIGTINPQARLHVSMGFIRADSLGSAGSTSLCHNASNQISTCSSSLRYKDQVSTYRAGLELINRLRPITFNWKADHKSDLGLVAEEVAAVEPLLVTHNDKGEIEGVKYAQLNVVLINAIKEQQTQLQSLLQANEALKTEKDQQIDSLQKQNAKLLEQSEVLKKENEAIEARLTALEKLLQPAAPVKK